MKINVDNNEYAAKASAIIATDFKDKERTSIKTKRANSLNESAGDKECSNLKSKMASRNTTDSCYC